MNLIDPDAALRSAFVLSEKYEPFEGPWHAHVCAQFVYASEGLLTTRTKSGLWVVPPGRAVWIVPNELHKGSAAKAFRLLTLYAKAGSVQVPQTNRVVSVDRLLDELMIEAAKFGADYELGGAQARLVQVILDRLPNLPTVPCHLPTPADARLLRLVSYLEQDPSDSRTLDALAKQSGMTARTAARLFVRETGLTFAQWRQQLRLLHAMQSLSLGQSVTNVAAEVGYSDVSAFIAMFKTAFGSTPARYIRTN